MSNRHNKLSHILVVREHDSAWAEEAKPQVLATAEAIHKGLADAGYKVVSLQVQTPEIVPTLLESFDASHTLVFNWYEGVEAGAEDCIQITRQLEKLEFTFTGADSLALEAAQDKLRTQRMLAAQAIPVPRSLPVTDEYLSQWKYYPTILKIANEHGSESLTEQSVVHDEAGLRGQVGELREVGYDQLMVSEFIEGREFTVSLWGNGNLQSLPILEVDFSAYSPPTRRMRSAAAKWETDSQEYQCVKLTCPQDLAPELHSRIERVARLAYNALRLRDYGRIDIRLRNGVPYVIDVNCNPDIEQDASFTMAAEYGGYDYSAMLARIVQFADHRRHGKY